MRKLSIAGASLLALCVTSANAADLPVKAPVKAAPVVAPYNWTGLYAGANIGYSWGESETSMVLRNHLTNALLSAQDRSFDMNGVIGGLQIGYNWQSSNWVVGIEADIQLSGQDGSTNFACAAALGCNLITGGPGFGQPATIAFNQSLDWFATLRARLGALVTPTMLFYVTGGLAVGHIETDGALTGWTLLGTTVSTPFSYDDTNAGWVVGVGLEGLLSGNWTGKIEYLYMDLGSVSGVAINTLSAPQLRAHFNSDITDHILRVGINYKFR